VLEWLCPQDNAPLDRLLGAADGDDRRGVRPLQRHPAPLCGDLSQQLRCR